MSHKDDALWYWNKYVKAKQRYLDIKGKSQRNTEDKVLIAEIMIGNLLRFIEASLADRKEADCQTK